MYSIYIEGDFCGNAKTRTEDATLHKTQTNELTQIQSDKRSSQDPETFRESYVTAVDHSLDTDRDSSY